MDKKVYYVIKGYSKLDYKERQQVREFIEDFEKKEYADREPLVESIQKSLGPTSSVCPCCGR